MNLVTAFDILDKARIVAIDQPATVLQIKYDGVSTAYNVEYWWNGEIKSVWLYEGELAALEAKEEKPTSTNKQMAKCKHPLIFHPERGVGYCNDCGERVDD